MAFVWLLSRSPDTDKAPDRPSDARKGTKKSGGVRIRTGSLRLVSRCCSGAVQLRLGGGCLCVPPRHAGEGGQVGTPRPRASGVGSAGVAGLGAFRGPMVFPTLLVGRYRDFMVQFREWVRLPRICSLLGWVVGPQSHQ